MSLCETHVKSFSTGKKTQQWEDASRGEDLFFIIIIVLHISSSFAFHPCRGGRTHGISCHSAQTLTLQKQPRVHTRTRVIPARPCEPHTSATPPTPPHPPVVSLVTSQNNVAELTARITPLALKKTKCACVCVCSCTSVCLT